MFLAQWHWGLYSLSLSLCLEGRNNSQEYLGGEGKSCRLWLVVVAEQLVAHGGIFLRTSRILGRHFEVSRSDGMRSEEEAEVQKSPFIWGYCKFDLIFYSEVMGVFCVHLGGFLRLYLLQMFICIYTYSQQVFTARDVPNLLLIKQHIRINF